MTTLQHRPIRSFVRREGRMTRAQERALNTLWPRFGVEPAGDPRAAFDDPDAPLNLEIGFGVGEFLLTAAERHPERNYLGVEVHRPGVGSVLNRLADAGLTNVRLACQDAVELLRDHVPDAALAGVYILFPDPWPKKRHHKRRLIQPAFVELLARRMAPGARLHLATDWEDYAEHMLAVLSDSPLVNAYGPGLYAPRPAERPPTRFERRGTRRGHGVWDLTFVKPE